MRKTSLRNNISGPGVSNTITVAVCSSIRIFNNSSTAEWILLKSYTGQPCGKFVNWCFVKLGKEQWALRIKICMRFCARLERHSLNIYRSEKICPTADADTKVTLNVCPISFFRKLRKRAY
jgi:hypothetical protein